MEKLNYIPDEEINLLENDLLGTYAYVEAVKKMVEDCKTPYTIGIFGSWGSGKSSIIKTLKEELEKKNSNKIKVFIYDAWKYSKDDLRRTFILKLRKSFGLNTEEEQQLFYKDKVEDGEFKPMFDKWRFFLGGSLIGGLIFAFAVSYFLLWNKLFSNIVGSSSFSTLIILFYNFITFLFSFMIGLLIYRRVAITTSKLFAPEQFEERFENTIKEIKHKTNIEKLVIVIDNIDRCHKEQAFEVLLTIKNFLSKKGVVFLVPVDDEGLKKYLQMSEQEANEFLRKLFNTSIRIKSSSGKELFDFGKELIEKYQIKIPKEDTVISLITQEFSKNPRRIIQMLNVLQTEYYLAKIQEEKGYIPKGAITDNIGMFVKLLIIREEWSDLYAKIQDNKRLMMEINNAIRGNEYSRNEMGLWEYKGSIEELKQFNLTEEQYRFFVRTSNIEMNAIELEPFFVNKDVFKGIPGIIITYIENQDWDNLKKSIENNEINLDKLLKFIDDKCNEDIIKRKLYETSGFNLVSLIFKIISDKGSEISDLPQYIKSVLGMDAIYTDIYKFPPKEFALSMRWFDDKKIKTPIDTTINKLNQLTIDAINTNKFSIQTLKEFILVFKDNKEILSEIKNKFSELLEQKFVLYYEFKEILESEAVKHLLDDDFAAKIIPTLQQDYTQNQIKGKVEMKILNECKVKILKILNKWNVLNQNTIEKYIDNVSSILEKLHINAPSLLRTLHPNPLPNPLLDDSFAPIQNSPLLGKLLPPPVSLPSSQNLDTFNFWLESLSGFVEKTNNQSIITSLFTTLSNNYDFVFQQFYNGQIYEPYLKVYKSFSTVAGELYLSTNDNNQKQAITVWLNQFFNESIQISKDNIFPHIIQIYQNIINKTDLWLFADNIITQLQQQNDINLKTKIAETVNLMMKKTDQNKGLKKEQIEKIIEHYFNLLFKGQDKAEKWIIELCENQYILNKIIEFIIAIPDTDKLEKCENIIYKELLSSTDSKKQEIGIRTLYKLKSKISDDKKQPLQNLLNDIDANKFDENTKKIIDELKEELK